MTSGNTTDRSSKNDDGAYCAPETRSSVRSNTKLCFQARMTTETRASFRRGCDRNSATLRAEEPRKTNMHRRMLYGSVRWQLSIEAEEASLKFRRRLAV